METENDLPKAYDASRYEDAISRRWEESGFYNPDNLPGERTESFSMVMPPPNVTGTLHIGHAVMLALEDIMVRFARMRGKKALWIPGTDHAAIATQTKVEKLVFEKEKKTRHDLGREAFLKRVEAFAAESHDTIVNQVKKMGCSCDWSREAYTLDGARGVAVNTAFARLYDLGLIRRGDRVVNWCPRCSSTLADDEVEHKEGEATLYTFRYAKDFPIAISTTRPETKFGDTGVAVHPDDVRYKAFVGKTVDVDFLGTPLSITVVADRAVDPAFGTGALGVTPAHSQIDEKIAGEHGLKSLQVIGEDARMTVASGQFTGMTAVEARAATVAALRDAGLIEKEEKVTQNLSVCYRCGTAIEPLPKLQWFLKVNEPFAFQTSKEHPIAGIADGQMVTLKELMLHVVRSKQIDIIPDRFEKTYYHWIENLRDWCISRQIWFGHQVPVWYHSACEAYDKTVPAFVGDTKRGKNNLFWCPNCLCGYDSIDHFERDHDTLDTWFSSGLWTFSTLGWPRTKVIFVRHGEAMSNAKGFNDSNIGNGENVLTERGERQVKERAQALKDSGAVAIIASPITRAKQTAAMLGEALQIPVTCDDRLREIGFGSYDGKDPATFDKARGFFDGWKKQSFADAESYLSVQTRSHQALQDILRTYVGKTVIVVTHGDTLAVMREFGAMGEKSYGYPEPAGAVEISFSADGKQADDLSVFHPTAMLETGYDILPFWVARMILMSTALTGEVPFKTVYLHGLVRDEQGRKMSKSLGNIIDPLDMIAKYGTDAVRLALVLGSTPGNDTRLSDDKIAGFRNFTNKLWNIGRYVLTTTSAGTDLEVLPEQTSRADWWIIGRLSIVASAVTEHLERHEFSAAGDALRDFTWNDFADWYLEITKTQKTQSEKVARATDHLLRWLLARLLQLWHPFMPFVTEVLWKELTGSEEMENLLFVQRWPEMNGWLKDEAESLRPYQDLVTAIRALRTEHRLQPKQVVDVSVDCADDQMQHEIAWMERLTHTKIRLGAPEKADGLARTVVGETTLYIDTAAGVDVAAECARLTKEAENLERYIATVDAKLANEEFASKAPAAVLEKEKGKRATAAGELAKIQEQLKLLQ
jgi:valyl-tRNA synthetase/broad specificity phosphatase PhoE